MSDLKNSKTEVDEKNVQEQADNGGTDTLDNGEEDTVKKGTEAEVDVKNALE